MSSIQILRRRASSIQILWSRAPAWRYLSIAAIGLTILAIVFPPPLSAPVPWAHPAVAPKSSAVPQPRATAGEANRMSCSREGSLRSPQSAERSVVKFQNNANSPVRLYWLDFSGARKMYGQYEPGKSRMQQTFAGHLWLVTDINDECIGIFDARANPSAVTIGTPPLPTAAAGPAAYFMTRQPLPEPSGLEMSPIDPAEASGAVSTMTGTPTQLALFADGAKSCRTPLARIAIAKRAGAAGGTIRFWSGGYVSPYFVLTETPQRIAIPYPAPYQQGHGVISVLGEASGAVLRFRPTWDLRQLTGQVSRNVSWAVDKNCGS